MSKGAAPLLGGVMATKHPDDLDEFQKFVKNIPRGKLVNMLCDAYWKNQLGKTEIQRFFLLSKKGVDMVGEVPPGRNRGPDSKTKARRKTSSRRAAKSKVRTQRGRRS